MQSAGIVSSFFVVPFRCVSGNSVQQPVTMKNRNHSSLPILTCFLLYKGGG